MTCCYIITGSHKPVLLTSNVPPTRPGSEAYSDIYMRLWDHLLEATPPNWNVIREYAQEDGTKDAVLRVQHTDAITIMGGKDTHPNLCGITQGYEAEGHHWCHTDCGRIALVDHTVRTGTPLLGACRSIQIISGRKPALKATEAHGRAHRERDQHLQWRQAVLGFSGYGGATKGDGEGEYECVHMDNDDLYKGYVRSTGAHAGRTLKQVHKTPGVRPPEHMHKSGTGSGELFAVWGGRKRSLSLDQEKNSLRAAPEATSASPSPPSATGSSVPPPSPPPAPPTPPVPPPPAQ